MKFREFETSSGMRVLGGRSAESNEKLILQIEPTEVVLHTSQPGSPFVNIKSGGKRIGKKDISEAAVFCARYSQDWRDNKKDVIVHVFKGKDVYKDKKMKLGTFGVRKHDKIKIKKEKIAKL